MHSVPSQVKWYRAAAAKGHLEAENNLAVVLLEHWKADSAEWREAIALLSHSASAGFAKSQNNLGHCYEFGKGVESDHEAAFEWYQRAAAQDHAPSMVNLGFLRLKRREYAEAFALFLAASRSANVDSWFYIGWMHSKGQHVPTNHHLAFQYFKRAAAAGHVASTLKLADAHFSGTGTATDYERALALYKQLAMDGHPAAANNVGIMIEDGLGTGSDPEAAAFWYKMASAKEHPDAQRNSKRLGLLVART